VGKFGTVGQVALGSLELANQEAIHLYSRAAGNLWMQSIDGRGFSDRRVIHFYTFPLALFFFLYRDNQEEIICWFHMPALVSL